MVVQVSQEWPDSGDIFLRQGFDSPTNFVDTVNYSHSANQPSFTLPAGTPLSNANIVGAVASTQWQKLVYKTVVIVGGTMNKVAVIDAKGTGTVPINNFNGIKLNLSCVPLRSPVPGSGTVWDLVNDWIPFCQRYGIAYSEESVRQDNQPK